MEIYPERSVARRAILASWLGWLMDGYISIAYLVQASYFIGLFFPKGLGILYYLFFVFSGAVRALGSAVLGNYIGDKLGRRKMMVVTVSVFSASGASIGLLPTYTQAGLLAPILLGVLLVIMGLFAGAEYGGGTALSMENIPPEKRNLVGAFVQGGFGTGYAILAVVFFLLSSHLSTAQYISYGWRVLFLSSGIVGLITLLVRRITSETRVFEEAKEQGEIAKAPLLSFLREQWIAVLSVLLITGSLLFVNTATFSLYPTLLSVVNGFSGPTVGESLILINALSVVAVVLGGFIASRSRKKMPYMLAYSIAFIAVSVAIASSTFSLNFATVTIGFILQGFVEGMIFSTLPAFLSEIFSKRFRTTGVGIVYNVGSAIGATALILIPFYSEVGGIWIHAYPVWPISVLAASTILLAGIVLSWRLYEVKIEKKDAIVD